MKVQKHFQSKHRRGSYRQAKSSMIWYNSTFHPFIVNFGFFAFINQAHFARLLSKGKAPRELTLIMIASAMRFAGKITPENLARADSWADAAIGALLARIYQGFGAIQLMASE
ncbi:hypothetical protein GQ53DRAFT_823854 [Thozetella sp. PMI_491]|nr:hypothetical protein GQ53DRAFT_823854 [Thozetella sp. PMI_491]